MPAENRCDIILASPTAVFGQPEINASRTQYISGRFVGYELLLTTTAGVFIGSNLQLGVIPGAGGTQRLTHAIGKSRAMELVLTGGNFSAQQASEWGLVSRVVEQGSSVVDEAVKVAGKIAGKGMLAVQAGKEGVNAGASLLFHARRLWVFRGRSRCLDARSIRDEPRQRPAL